MTEDDDFDIVIHVLQTHRNQLWKMTQQNMNSEFMSMGIMDDIRLEQIDQLDGAIKWYKVQKSGSNQPAV